MKKVFLTSLILGLTFICTGCVKFDYNIEINKDAQIKISQTQAFNVKFFRAINPAFDTGFKKSVEELSKKYREAGFKTAEYNDDAFSGVTVIKDKLTFNNVTEALPEGFNKDEGSFIANRGFIKSSYKIHLFYDLGTALGSQDIKTGQRISSAGMPQAVLSRRRNSQYINGQLVDMNSVQQKYDAIEGEKPDIAPVSKLTIKIPAKASKHNADTLLSDKEYQWNLAATEQPAEIILEYEIIDLSKIAMTLSMIVLLGAVLILVQRVQKSDVVKGL